MRVLRAHKEAPMTREIFVLGLVALSGCSIADGCQRQGYVPGTALFLECVRMSQDYNDRLNASLLSLYGATVQQQP